MIYTTWDVKQLIEVVSKGINSVLMSDPKADIGRLKELSAGLLEIYQGIYTTLKTEETPDKNEPEYDN